MSTQPSFAFIVGAPRCGTTTLASFLRQHPDICFSSVKEPHYFTQFNLSELSDRELAERVEHDYLDRYFDHCQAEKIKAEGSVTYLYAPENMEPVLRLWPDAKFIIALRDPLAMLPSLHARLLVTGDENIPDFKRAWATIPDRANGKAIPRTAIDPRFLQYDAAGALGSRVEQFFRAVGRDRCHVVLFDDLANDPATTYRDLCGFLGIEPWPSTKLKQRRKHMTFRYGWLQRLLKRPPKPVRTILAGEKFRKREKNLGAGEGPAIKAVFKLRKRLLDWNKVPAKRENLDEQVREEIIDRLRDEVILLSRIMDRDLSHWLGGVPEANPHLGQAKRA